MTNLILLLSAMLSALVGVGPAARVVATPAAVAGSVAAEVAVAPSRAVIMRPGQARVTLASVLAIGLAILFFVPAIVPAWANRRRE